MRVPCSPAELAGPIDEPPVPERCAPRGSLTPYLDLLPVPPVLRPDGGVLTVRLRASWQRLHSELPPSELWTFGGSFPGPTIEVRRGQRLWVEWRNEIKGTLPVLDVRTTDPEGPSRPGHTEQDEVIAAASLLRSWTVVHLHGARTNAASDGWSFNAVHSGNSQLVEYANDQPATALWYHDHAMGITALNVMAGLAGVYLIRDGEEDALGLPHGDREIPLVICDRNLATTPEGELTGRLMRKLYRDPSGEYPFTGPFTLVNGRIWPYCEVTPQWYRFRLLNASNSRFYRLRLADESGAVFEPGVLRQVVKQIGTDSGLLPEPVELPEGGLVLAPAERADLLVDFSQFEGGSVQLLNDAPDAAASPQVMRFDVTRFAGAEDFCPPKKLSASFVRLTHDTLPTSHAHRWVLLTPPQLTGGPMIWEMVEVDESSVTLPQDGVVQVQLPGQPLRTLKRVATAFEDTVNYFVVHGGWEQWNLLNLSGAGMSCSHPMHLHLMAFQALSRDKLTVDAFTRIGDTGFGTLPGQPITHDSPGVLDANEQGWKDVIRVGPGELIPVVGQFDGGTGEFMYHCHILEHEDDMMMRPFVVVPADVLALHPMGGHGGHH
ncbi:multicopper oxidase family protein [Kutzneria albida]|uniref:Phenoxazinone synthase n=1 Tax=Kutzneria albida DSM 43870 TaxID=1449976 RepID=W5WF36_9PSEU|nr:multicopper oxidase domain-containing protein [Kutzneria albida]AHH96774.1 Phenoxazinone synthase [Kutzneria albida DSM 43870]